MSEKGTVYFFTGLSGAGKTTIGGLFHQRLKATKPNVVLLDGKVSRDTLLQRNQKGLYTSGKNVVGIDLPFDEP